MNSDTAFDQIENQQYIYGQNVRITKNQLLGGADDYSSLHEGIVTPVLQGIDITTLPFTDNKILAVDSVDRLCTIVASNDNGDLSVYRLDINEEENQVESFKELWRTTRFWSDIAKRPGQLSTVLYKELENVIKLYITTGSTPMIIMRVDDEGEHTLKYGEDYTPIDYLINNRIVPQNRVYIQNIISGHLTTSQVQYTYRYYNKYASTSQLAPLTNKIQVIDPSRSKEIGNAEDTETSVGFTITINTIEDNIDYKEIYDRIQVFRLSFIKPGEDSVVQLIYDGDINSTNGVFTLNDVGIEPLQELSIEEFSSLSGLLLVPQVIEQNQEYMFCANIKDDTILKDVKLQNTGNSLITPITASVQIAKQMDGRIPVADNTKYSSATQNTMRDSNGNSISKTVSQYIEERGVNPNLATITYNNPITSSLLRSLRRGETYRYGIVFYDRYGRRTDVLKIGDVSISKISSTNLPFSNDIQNGNGFNVKPVGVQIDIPTPIGEGSSDIIGCQIVRRSSADIYQNTLLQVALARPVSQGLSELTDQDEDITKYSPFYPTGFLCVNDFKIFPHAYQRFSDRNGENQLTKLQATTKNTKLYQIFSSEIDYRRDDVLSRLNVSDTKIEELAYIPAKFSRYNGSVSSYNTFSGLTFNGNDVIIDRKDLEPLTTDKKQSYQWILNYFPVNTEVSNSNFEQKSVSAIKDVKIPHWDSGFTNTQMDGEYVYDAIRNYKSYSTTIGEFTFNNWISFCKYDFRVGKGSYVNNNTEQTYDNEFVSTVEDYTSWLGEIYGYNLASTPISLNQDPGSGYHASGWGGWLRSGYIGCGGSCFLLTTDTEAGSFDKTTKAFYTSICNITHTSIQDNVESDDYTQYFGFGNYFRLKWDNGVLKTLSGDTKLTVFDGDIYITPHEFTTEFKTYNFQSVDTLQSTQITNYIPLESKVNTYFDYGMNLLNTNSANLMYEPGSIDGVTTQERPLHQYNTIYSDNDASNDVFTLISTDSNETNQFKQRAYYSEPKSNGEFIDNFPIFKPAAFIDVDSKYGQLTNMLTDKNSLFYWQEHAFGKFSVNERSLINDQNGNTIMLGQAGILSRYDYLSTKFGMRLYDFCARTAEQGLYWVDINNKAVVSGSGEGAINYGEQLGVQNIINNKITTDIPKVDYDLQNNELLCKCFGNNQIVFNVKYNIPTSIYTRLYDDMVYIKNHLFGLYKDEEQDEIVVKKHNYISYAEGQNDFLRPIKLDFIVNPSASITKVFDSQQLTPIKRDSFEAVKHILTKTQLGFETDLVDKTYGEQMEPYTDREGNIIYNIPRYKNMPYGNRIRGKWMRVNILNNDPSEYFTISHVITKYRQSFS